MFRYYDFFAGAGLAGLGLGPRWRCVYAIDNDAKKIAAYKANFGGKHVVHADIHDIDPHDLPDAELAWASFPCQDLSLAGRRAGLSGGRSSAYWGFWRVMSSLKAAGRCPKTIVVENVPGLLRGASFTAICDSLAQLGMNFGAVVMDAARFVPQSRSRVFLVGAEPAHFASLAGSGPDPHWTSPALVRAANQLSKRASASWLWWRLPPPPPYRARIETALDAEDEARWWPETRTQAFLKMMSDQQRRKLEEIGSEDSPGIGLAYKRTRQGRQCAEVRIDGLAGCLRAPRGGSSRQIVAAIDGGRVRARLLSAREAARLMGVPETYILPRRYTDAYHAMGDGVVIPVVRWLSDHLLQPITALAYSNIRAGAGHRPA